MSIIRNADYGTDSFGEYWTGSEWSCDRGAALVYGSPVAAEWAAYRGRIAARCRVEAK